MFGFIRPVKDELRVREVHRFQEVYCGLCPFLRLCLDVLRRTGHVKNGGAMLRQYVRARPVSAVLRLTGPQTSASC